MDNSNSIRLHMYIKDNYNQEHLLCFLYRLNNQKLNFHKLNIYDYKQDSQLDLNQRIQLNSHNQELMYFYFVLGKYHSWWNRLYKLHIQVYRLNNLLNFLYRSNHLSKHSQLKLLIYINHHMLNIHYQRNRDRYILNSYRRRVYSFHQFHHQNIQLGIHKKIQICLLCKLNNYQQKFHKLNISDHIRHNFKYHHQNNYPNIYNRALHFFYYYLYKLSIQQRQFYNFHIFKHILSNFHLHHYPNVWGYIHMQSYDLLCLLLYIMNNQQYQEQNRFGNYKDKLKLNNSNYFRHPMYLLDKNIKEDYQFYFLYKYHNQMRFQNKFSIYYHRLYSLFR